MHVEFDYGWGYVGLGIEAGRYDDGVAYVEVMLGPISLHFVFERAP